MVGGFDPIYFTGEERLTRDHLDGVRPTDRSSCSTRDARLATVNTAMLERQRDHPRRPPPGVDRDAVTANRTAKLQEMPAMAWHGWMAGRPVARSTTRRRSRRSDRSARTRASRCCATSQRSRLAVPTARRLWHEVVDQDDYPWRILQRHVHGRPAGSTHLGRRRRADAAAGGRRHRQAALRRRKIVLDGSIQGWTAKMGWPGYYTGDRPRAWTVPPEQFVDWPAVPRGRRQRPRPLQRRPTIDALDRHRRTTRKRRARGSTTATPSQHCQLTTRREFRRDGEARHVRQHLRQPPLVLGRPAPATSRVGPERANGWSRRRPPSARACRSRCTPTPTSRRSASSTRCGARSTG